MRFSAMSIPRDATILALTLLFIAVALTAETRETTREIPARAVLAAPLAAKETSSDRNIRPFSRASNLEWSVSSRDEEREKTLAWVLLLIKEHRGAR
jgi:hypothetical protein